MVTVAGFLLGLVPGLIALEAFLTSGIDADVSLDQVSATSEEAQVDLRYRVASSDEELGPVRLFLDIVDTNAKPFDFSEDAGDSLRASFMAGDEEVAVQLVPLDLVGEEQLLRLEPEMSWRPASGADVNSDQQVVIDETVKRQGFVLGRAGPDSVVEGTLASTVSQDRETPLKVNAYVREVGSEEWKLRTDASPGDRLELLIRAENVSGSVLEDLVIGANLADYLSYVPDSTTIINTNHPDGIEGRTNNVYQGGIDIGAYESGSVAYVKFEVQVAPSSAFEQLGRYTLRNVGIARAQGTNEVYNVAIIDVNVEGE